MYNVCVCTIGAGGNKSNCTNNSSTVERDSLDVV